MDIEQDLKILKDPKKLLNLYKIKKAIFKKITNLEVTISESDEPVNITNKAINQRKIGNPHIWGKAFSCAWFHITGSVPQNVKNNNLCVLLDIGAEGLIFDKNDKAVVGLSNPLAIMSVAEFLNPPIGKTFMFLPKESDNKIDLWVDAGFNGYQGKEFGHGLLYRANLSTFDENIYGLYFDYLAVLFAKETYRGDLESKASDALNKSYKEFTKGNILSARKILKPIIESKSNCDLTVTAIGHSHLDLAWLWPIRETKRKAARTLSNALRNMERYPDYIYGASQPQEFTWIKKDYPDIFESIKKAYIKGQFEPQGGMWVECDTNITGGESLIRQFLYGMKFWEDEFGATVNNCWLPDVFGYSAALPQIMKKCGIDYFMTQKLSWNEHNDFPLETFNWHGLSDDSVLVHLLPGNNYNSSGAATTLKELYVNHTKKSETHEALMLYGAGDGGGGPCQTNIELIKRYNNMAELPKVKIGKACDFFEELNKKNYDLPNYKGELYLEKHQGTYTTQSNSKKNNHDCEKELHYLEAAASAAKSKGYIYPKGKIDNLWNEILLYQFHDILPGSSIHRVYKESNERYKIILDEIRNERNRALSYLSKDKNEKALNLSPYENKGYIKSNSSWYSFNAKPYSSSELSLPQDDFTVMKSDGNYMENDIISLRIMPSGEIISVKDKKTGYDYAGDTINALDLYYDKKLFYNAWDIDINYTKQTPKRLKRTSFNAYIDGPLAVTENIYKFGKSTISQKIIIKKGVPYVTFETDVDWHETHRMLRANFVPSSFSKEVTCDIQFGNIKRSTETKTKIQWAQFEVCAHKFVDVTGEKYGTAILSDAKYGFRVKDGLISLNLLRSPVYPDKTADRGSHKIRYAYYPHKNDCFDAEVPKESYLFNQPALLSYASLNIDAETDKRNIIVETIKPSENGKGIVFRLYENEGKETDCVFNTNLKINKLYETDMREKNPVEVTNVFNFKPFEIKTLYAEMD